MSLTKGVVISTIIIIALLAIVLVLGIIAVLKAILGVILFLVSTPILLIPTVLFICYLLWNKKY